MIDLAFTLLRRELLLSLSLFSFFVRMQTRKYKKTFLFLLRLFLCLRWERVFLWYTSYLIGSRERENNENDKNL